VPCPSLHRKHSYDAAKKAQQSALNGLKPMVGCWEPHLCSRSVGRELRPSGLEPVGIHHLLLSNLTTDYCAWSGEVFCVGINKLHLQPPYALTPTDRYCILPFTFLEFKWPLSIYSYEGEAVVMNCHSHCCEVHWISVLCSYQKAFTKCHGTKCGQ